VSVSIPSMCINGDGTMAKVLIAAIHVPVLRINNGARWL
jgi:hypothetical protein